MAQIALSNDFKEFLRLLTAHEVRYLIVGGYAVAIHGHVRATGDLDIYVDPAADNARQLVAALREFGFDGPQINEVTFSNPSLVFSAGVEPVKLELMTTISGLGFAECYARRETTMLDGVPIQHLNRADLLANKRAAGRLQDLADIEALARKR